MLHLNDIVLRIGGRVLLERATAAVNAGERVGLVGRNGTGKSTLLRAIAGEVGLDGGAINRPKRMSLGYLRQEAPSSDEALVDVVLAADQERARLLEEAEGAKDPHRISEIHTRLADIEAHAAPARAARILAGLGFDESAQQRPVNSFSGGWRMRVALAALLFSRPDLLLLDEPTNYLDLEATLWLEGFLKTYPGTLLIVSHDRRLLNEVPQKIIHLEDKRLTTYSGNFDRFQRTRAERLEHQAAEAAKIAAQRRHMQKFVDRFRYKASKARQAQARLKMLERLQPITTGGGERAALSDFSFPKPEPISPPIVNLEDAAVGYGQTAVLKDLDLRIDMDDRIALLGANGNGKSTLMRLLAGRLKPSEGRVVKSAKLKIGYFSQDQAERLNLKATPLEHMAELMPMATETKQRAQLGRFGFGEDKAEIKVEKLSGGERARLVFALITREAPQLLLLDEPTNHLDIEARQALIEALNDYEGAVILVTHDPHLIGLVADRLWLVADGGVVPFEGDMEDYRRMLLEERRSARAEVRATKGKSADGGERAKARREKAADRQALQPLKRKLAEAETRLTKLSDALAALEKRLADPATYDADPAKLAELNRRHAEITQAIEKTEAAWLDAQAALEEASG